MFRGNTIKTRPSNIRSAGSSTSIATPRSKSYSARSVFATFSTDRGLHMYRAEGRGSVYRFPSNRISVTYASRERVYSYRWSEISIVTRFRGSVLGRRRTCLWLIPRRPPVATRPIQRTRIERERESRELCRGEREYCYANWIPMTCHRSSLPIRGTLGNREFFPFPSYREVFPLLLHSRI